MQELQGGSWGGYKAPERPSPQRPAQAVKESSSPCQERSVSKGPVTSPPVVGKPLSCCADICCPKRSCEEWIDWCIWAEHERGSVRKTFGQYLCHGTCLWVSYREWCGACGVWSSRRQNREHRYAATSCEAVCVNVAFGIPPTKRSGSPTKRTRASLVPWPCALKGLQSPTRRQLRQGEEMGSEGITYMYLACARLPCNRVPELQVLCEPIFPVPHCPSHHQINRWNWLTSVKRIETLARGIPGTKGSNSVP